MNIMDKLFLLDAYALIYRSYYAFMKAPRINSKGLNTSCVMGFCNTLNEILTKEKPTHIAVAFDHGKTFRHEAFPAYKAQREETPEDIKLSVPIIKNILEAYHIPILQVDGFEADDIIGTVALKAGEMGIETYNDKDDYEAGGTGWSGHGTGCSGCTICMMNKVEGKPAMIPSDVSGQGEKRVKLPDPVTVEQAREILKKVREAKRPVINAGNGIRIGKAFDVFARVVKKLGIPVVTGWNSIDCMYDTDPLYVGRAGHMGDRAGNFAVQNSDLLLSLGSRLSIRQVGYNYPTWAREAYVIYNDIDAEELKKPTVHVDMPVHADVRDLLEKLELVLDEEEFDPNGGAKDKEAVDWWIRRCQEWKEKYPVVLPKHYEAGDDEPANVYAAIKEISRRGEEDQITVVGNGSACVVGGHAYEMKKGQRFISNSAIASMGYDLPAAIGAWVADHTKDIILVTGDGSIQMNLQELQTIVHHHMGIKIFLINNGGYHSIRQTQKTHFHEPLVGIGVDSHDLSFPSMEKLAWAYGYPYVAAHHNSELGEAVEKTLAMDGPVICEIFVDMKQGFEPKAAAKMLPDGTMVSVPLEDLAPFLPEEELKKNMIIPLVENK